MPGTTPYTEDSALADAFPATSALHFHAIVVVVVGDIATSFLYAGHVVVIGVDVVVVVVRTEDAVPAICLRLDLRLQFHENSREINLWFIDEGQLLRKVNKNLAREWVY